MNSIDIEEYNKRIKNEKKFYEGGKYRENLTEKSSSALTYLLDKFQERVTSITGKTVWDNFISIVNKKCKNSTGPIRILSIGSGPGGTEMNLARQFPDNYTMDCLDINDESIKIGQQKADEAGFHFKFIQTDINFLILPIEKYDVIFAHASLHHIINHEHVAKEIRKSMKEDALYLVYDVIVRNGMRIWEETKAVANPIFAKLPEKYRYNPLAINENERYLTELPDEDVSKTGFECIRSQDLYQALKTNFKIKIEVPGFSFARRFVDEPLGNNYDMNNPEDKAIVDTIIKLDNEYTLQKNLKPESIFLILEK